MIQKRAMNTTKLTVTFLFLSILFIPTVLSQGKLERVEPAFWWAGMKNKNLQLLIYGKEISNAKPTLDYEGVNISKVVSVENPNYLFIYLHIGDEAKPGHFDIEFKLKNKVYAAYKYELKARASNSASRQGFSPSDVLYLITPDRFVNGDPDNDDLPGMEEIADRANNGGRHGGDIKGIHDHLSYIKSMGFTAIWLNPVLENNMPSYSYHGYAATDFYKVDPRFGTNEDYLNLSIDAGKKGIKLVMDMILNHCGSEHWWIKDLPTSNWLNNQDGFKGTTHRRTTIQDPYRSQIDYDEFANGWFVETMPDLNQKNELLATYLIQNSIWWIEYAKLSGIRMDTYPYPDMYFMSEWTCKVMEEYPNFNIVGEEWTSNPALVAHWQRGKENANGYSSCLPSLMDFPIQESLVKSLNDKESAFSGLRSIYEMLANDFLYADPFNLVTFPDNHDMDRFFTQINEDFGLFKNGIVYFATMRGIPQFYYGTEILMTNSQRGDHGDIRSDFPGGWIGDEKNAFTENGLTRQEKEAKTFVQKVLNWRKTASAIHKGKLVHYNPKDGIYVYFRFYEAHKIMVILNKNKREVSLDLTRFKEMLDGKKVGLEIISGKQINLVESLNLLEESPMIIELK